MTRAPLPPRLRSRVALGLTAAASRGLFALQHCDACGDVQFPPQEFCGTCLGTQLDLRDCPSNGTLVAEATLHHSLEPAFAGELPLRTGLVRHQSGAMLVAFLHPDCAVDEPVRASLQLDRGGNAVVTAAPVEEDEPMSRCTYSPKGRTCLVTDGRGRLGRAVASALSAAGAAEVLTAPEDCEQADIVVDTAWLSGSLAQLGVRAADTAALADRLLPSVAERGGAWVSVLSFAALAPYPASPDHSARMATAQALTVSFRARLQNAGAGALAIYPARPAGLDDCGFPVQPTPPETLAKAVVVALEEGREETFPDAQSRLWSERQAKDRKALERELAWPQS